MPRTPIIPAAATGEPRSYEGTGNNLTNPTWGSVGERLLRMAPADYADRTSSPAGAERPNPREISNAIMAQAGGTPPNGRQLSALIFVWGQFIDHDIELTQAPTTACEALPIAVPAGDPVFDPAGTRVDNPREQVNLTTAWIDGSMVYGSDRATADSLRTFVGGKLRTSKRNLPPADEEGNFLTGDTRANVNIELTAMHALLIREHNWWADEIALQNPRISDEEIYQQARAIVIAEIQAITFNEFLPALIGEDAISSYSGYDSAVDPRVAHEFSTAAYRMHTWISDDLEFYGNDGRAVHEKVTRAEAFNNPDLIRATGADSILKFLASTQAKEFDNQIVDSLRNSLFGKPGQGGLDLASVDIQRGRGHGLADYNAVRQAYGLARVESFAEITADPELQQLLHSVYGSVDNIDLWVGALAEDHVPGSSVGALMRAIVADQFERLRNGDRFWYEENIFSGEAIQQIESTSLADILARNTAIDNLQPNVFFMRAEVSGQIYADSNGNGRQDRREQGLSGVTVELLDDEGHVITTTVTGARGCYRFDTFRKTGDYQVRAVIPSRWRATTATAIDVLISRGDEAVAGINVGLRWMRNAFTDVPRDRRFSGLRGEQPAALNAARTAESSLLLQHLVERAVQASHRGA